MSSFVQFALLVLGIGILGMQVCWLLCFAVKFLNTHLQMTERCPLDIILNAGSSSKVKLEDITLTYFDLRGRAEATRLLLEEIGVPYK